MPQCCPCLEKVTPGLWFPDGQVFVLQVCWAPVRAVGVAFVNRLGLGFHAGVGLGFHAGVSLLCCSTAGLGCLFPTNAGCGQRGDFYRLPAVLCVLWVTKYTSTGCFGGILWLKGGAGVIWSMPLTDSLQVKGRERDLPTYIKLMLVADSMD